MSKEKEGWIKISEDGRPIAKQKCHFKNENVSNEVHTGFYFGGNAFRSNEDKRKSLLATHWKPLKS